MALKKIGFNGRPFSSTQQRGFLRHTLNLLKAIHTERPEIELYLYSDIPIADDFKKDLGAYVHFRDSAIRPHVYWEQLVLPELLIQDNIDVYHSTINTGIPLRRKAKLPAFVLTLHDMITHEQFAQLPRNLRKRDWLAYLNFKLSWLGALKHSKRVVTVSNFSKSKILKTYPELSPRIQVIPNGVDPVFLKENRPSNREMLHELNVSQPYILYVGGFEERKNVAFLLKTFASLREIAPRFDLVLVGNCSQLSEELSRLKREVDHVKWLGFQSDESVAALYSNAFCGVLPSKEEGFGLQVIEGMASGLPMLIAHSTSLPEVAGDAALSFNLENEASLIELVLKLEQDTRLRQDLITKGLKHSRAFSWKNVAQETIAVYESACLPSV